MSVDCSTLATCGSTASATLIQLLTLGAQSHHLVTSSVSDGTSLFRGRVTKLTNFAMEEQTTEIQNAQFGKTCKVQIDRSKDLVGNLCVVIKLPGIVASMPASGTIRPANQYPVVPNPFDPMGDGPAPDHYSNFAGATDPFLDPESNEPCEADCQIGQYATWVNDVGFALLECVEINLGGQKLDVTNGWILKLYSEFTTTPAHDYSEMVGSYDNPLDQIRNSCRSRRLYVPLNAFWLNKGHSNMLPLVSLQFHSVSVSFTFSPLNKLIQVSSNEVQVINTDTVREIGNTDLQAELMMTSVFCDNEERDLIAATSHESLIVTSQYRECSFSAHQNDYTVDLGVNHPCKGACFTLQREKARQLGNWFNFASKWEGDIALQASILLNSNPRVDGPISYFTKYQPYLKAINNPKRNYAAYYSFGAGCMFHKANTGTINMSRIDRSQLTLKCIDKNLKGDNENNCAELIYVQILIPSYNTLKIQGGMGGLMYSN